MYGKILPAITFDILLDFKWLVIETSVIWIVSSVCYSKFYLVFFLNSIEFLSILIDFRRCSILITTEVCEVLQI